MADMEITGVWWLPSLPERRVVGTFRWEPGTFPRLELIGSFSDKPQLGCDVTHPIVLGVAEQHMITLVNCLQTSATLASPGVYKEKYTATVAYSGFHAENNEDLLFSSLTIGYRNLDRWIGAKCVEYQRSEGEERGKRRIGVSIGFPEPIRVSPNTQKRPRPVTSKPATPGVSVVIMPTAEPLRKRGFSTGCFSSDLR